GVESSVKGTARAGMAGERSPGEFFSAAWRSLPRSNHTTRVKTGSDMDLYEHRRRLFALGTLPWPCTVQANRYPTAPQQLLPGNFLQPRSQDLRTLWPHDVVLPAHARTTCVDSTTHEDVKGRTPTTSAFLLPGRGDKKKTPGQGGHGLPAKRSIHPGRSSTRANQYTDSPQARPGQPQKPKLQSKPLLAATTPSASTAPITNEVRKKRMRNSSETRLLRRKYPNIVACQNESSLNGSK